MVAGVFGLILQWAALLSSVLDLRTFKPKIDRAKPSIRYAEMLGWLDSRPEGREYLGRLLVLMHAFSSPEEKLFREGGGFQADLASQIKLLGHPKLGSICINAAGQEAIVGQLAGTIIRTAATDSQSPVELRQWLAYRQRHADLFHGVEVARKYWPDGSWCREAFVFVIQHLELHKGVINFLSDRHAPRRLARALANSAGGRMKAQNKTNEPAGVLVAGLRKVPELKRTFTIIRRLVFDKSVPAKRKDAAAKRLKQALEEQFRIWCKPSAREMVAQSVGSCPPWAFQRELETGEGRKKLPARMVGHWNSISEKPSSYWVMDRYLRQNVSKNGNKIPPP